MVINTVATLLALLLGPLAPEQTYFAYTTETMTQDGASRQVFVPFSFSGPAETQLERRFQVVFQRLHAPRAGLWGSTSVQLTTTAAGAVSARLTLDPAKILYHDFILGEIYLTLANLGVAEIYLQPEGRRLGPADLRYPYFATVVPAPQALPPARFGNAVIRLPSGAFLPSDEYYQRLARRDEATLKEVLALLTTGSPAEKLPVMQALAPLGIGDRRARLLPLMQDADEGIRKEALALLSGEKDATFLEAAARMADGDKSTALRLDAARVLVAAGRSEYQIFLLFDKLQSGDKGVILDTIRSLAASGDKRVMAALDDLVKSGDPDISKAAFDAYLSVCETTDLVALVAREDLLTEYRALAAERLLQAKLPEQLLPAVTFLATKGTDFQTMDALRVVEMRRPQGVAPLLAQLMQDPRVNVALKAVELARLLKLTELIGDLNKAEGRKELGEAPGLAARELLLSMDLGDLLKLADSKDPATRVKATNTLMPFLRSDRDRPRVLPVLKKGLQDSSADLRAACARAIFETGDPKLLADLAGLGGDADSRVRVVAVKAASTLPGAPGDGPILALIDDPDDEVKLEVIGAISARRIVTARDKLRYRVTQRDPRLKAAALAAIVNLNQTPAEHELFFQLYQSAVLDMDPGVKLAGLEGLKYIRNDAVTMLLLDGTLLTHGDARVRAKAMEVMGGTRNPEVIENLARGLGDKDKTVQKAAILAFKQLGNSGGEIPLEEFVNNTDDETLRGLAKEALAVIRNPASRGLLP
jgi:HEAT repeat protein